MSARAVRARRVCLYLCAPVPCLCVCACAVCVHVRLCRAYVFVYVRLCVFLCRSCWRCRRLCVCVRARVRWATCVRFLGGRC